MLVTPMSLLDKLYHPKAEEAWRQFVDLYTPLFCHWLKRLNVSESDVHDLLQDVFLQLYRKIPEFQRNRRGHFHGWLHAVLKHKALEWIRRHHPQVPLHSDIMVSAEPNIDEAEYRQYLVNRLLQLMKNSFSNETWRACWESVVEGRSADAVAKELGITVNMVYLAKSRVLRQLRQEIAGLID